MNWVSTHRRHYTQMIRRGLIAISVCALAGCWQEVQYAPPASAPSGAASSETSPSESAVTDHPATRETPAPAVAMPSDVGGFADDVATSLAPDAEPKPVDQLPPVSETPVSSALPWETPAKPDEQADEKLASPSPIDDLFAEPATPAESVTPSTAKSEPTGIGPAVELPSAVPARGAIAKPQAAHNTRRMAWLLGSKLSLAALANDRGAPADEVAKWFGQAQSLAKMLGTSADPLPTPAPTVGNSAPLDQALGYLFTQGQQIGQDLARKYGAEQAALFEMAVKSNIVLALYKPGEVVVDTLSAAIRQAGERAKLPVELYQPLLVALAQGAPAAEVRDAVFKLHAEIDRYLSQSDSRDSFSSREPMQ